MAKSRASRPPHSVERKEHATERGWSNLLNMWHVCANAACRHARSCRGSPSYCYPHNFPQLPEGVQDWFLLLGEFQEEGLPFEEAWEGLGKAGLVDEFSNWHDLAHGRGASSAVT